MTFPQIVATLIQEGFESYLVDFRRATATYYRPDGKSVELPTHKLDTLVAAGFDVPLLQAAIKEAQQLVPGYTYLSFCEKAVRAGCAGTSCHSQAVGCSISAGPPRRTWSAFRANSAKRRV